MEPPRTAAGLDVVRIEEAARRAIAATDADDHLALGDARRHRDREVVLRVSHPRFPDWSTCRRIEREQAAIDDWRDDHALVQRDTAIDDAAADLGTHRGLVDLRIPSPLLFAGSRIDREDDAPIGDRVDDTIHCEGCGFLAAA